MILVRGAEIADSNNFSKNYMSIAGTNLIKGVFVSEKRIVLRVNFCPIITPTIK